MFPRVRTNAVANDDDDDDDELSVADLKPG